MLRKATSLSTKLLFPADSKSILTPWNKPNSSSEVCILVILVLALDWLDRVIKDVTLDEVNSDNAIIYKVRVHNIKIDALYDTGASISGMSLWFFNKLENKPKLIKYNRSISGAGGGTLIPVGKCFIQVQIGNKIFRDKVIAIENLKRDHILGQVLHRANRFGMGYSTNGRHYITLNREMLAQSCFQLTTNPILKTKR